MVARFTLPFEKECRDTVRIPITEMDFATCF
jgi:hypothetical protein